MFMAATSFRASSGIVGRLTPTVETTSACSHVSEKAALFSILPRHAAGEIFSLNALKKLRIHEIVRTRPKREQRRQPQARGAQACRTRPSRIRIGEAPRDMGIPGHIGLSGHAQALPRAASLSSPSTASMPTSPTIRWHRPARPPPTAALSMQADSTFRP